MIPLFHDLTGERVLVLGGGRVGARRARHFGVDADVVVVSDSFAAVEFGDAELVRDRLDPADVGGYLDRVDPAVAVAATDDAAVNTALVRAASDRGVLHNRVDGQGASEVGRVSVPGTHRDGPVTVAVGTEGTSPALAGYLVDRIGREFEHVGEMASLCASVRADLAAADVPAATRHEALRTLVRSEAVWTALDRGGANPRQLAADVVRDVAGDST